jgi:hypothetical protein
MEASVSADIDIFRQIQQKITNQRRCWAILVTHLRKLPDPDGWLRPCFYWLAVRVYSLPIFKSLSLIRITNLFWKIN